MTNEELVERVRAGNANIIELWQQMKRFIRKVARRYEDHAELDDLMQESFFALERAVALYDPGGGSSFKTYLHFWLRSYMRKCCMKSIRVPVNQKSMVFRYKNVVSDYQRDFGRKPSKQEVCSALQLTENQYNNIVSAVSAGQICSLSDPLVDDLTLGETIAGTDDVETEVLDRIEQEELRKRLWEIVDTLPEKYAKTIRNRYLDNKTLNECGTALGVSLQRVQQYESDALRALRKQEVLEQIRPYLDDRRYSMGVKGSTEKAAIKIVSYLEQLEKDGLI